LTENQGVAGSNPALGTKAVADLPKVYIGTKAVCKALTVFGSVHLAHKAPYFLIQRVRLAPNARNCRYPDLKHFSTRGLLLVRT
jgi:hypothetical protein